MRLHTLTETTFLLRKRFSQFRPRPYCADVTQAQIWKSLHIVAAIAMAVLTREREISTCPHHIPARALNSTHLLSEPKSNPQTPAAKKKKRRERKKERKKPTRSARILFRCFERKTRETGDEEQLPYPDQM